MLTVGLTGGIGSGKSAVAARLATHGAAVIDADRVAREVVAPGTPGLASVVQAFGPEVLDETGALDRPRLGRLVFTDDQKRHRLNAIVHPLIGARTLDLMAEAAGADYLVHDVPLLVENGLAPAYHLVVVVDALLDIRLARLADRGLPPEEANARIAAQAGADDRRAVADVWLDNGGSLEELHVHVDALHHSRLLPYAENVRASRYVERRPCVTVVSPDPTWARQGERLVARLRHLAPAATSIEHLGSTAVPGLPAKDVLDVQVEVADWSAVEELRAPLADGGFPRNDDIRADPPRPQLDPDPQSWRKRVHRNADPGRAVNVHVRVAGSAGARAATTFSDALRADTGLRDRYAARKIDLARQHPEDVDAYAEAKTAFILEVLTHG